MRIALFQFAKPPCLFRYLSCFLIQLSSFNARILYRGGRTAFDVIALPWSCVAPASVALISLVHVKVDLPFYTCQCGELAGKVCSGISLGGRPSSVKVLTVLGQAGFWELVSWAALLEMPSVVRVASSLLGLLDETACLRGI